jgi:hypothetical protein
MEKKMSIEYHREIIACLEDFFKNGKDAYEEYKSTEDKNLRNVFWCESEVWLKAANAVEKLLRSKNSFAFEALSGEIVS